MKYVLKSNKVTDMKIAYIGGGSRGWARTFMTDLAMEDALSGEIRLYDIDHNAAKQNEMIGNMVSAREDAPGKWIYHTYPTLEEALDGVDFVVISILPGTFDEMEVDVHMPERLSIYQSVGDTAGPGGIIRALRTLPMFAVIAETIKEKCPDAWVINYTNPMTLCVKTLYQVFPQIKALGCCHEVFGTQKVLAGILEEEMGLTDIPRQDIHVNVVGINHFTWFTAASYKGIDLFPVYKNYIQEHFEEGYNEPDHNWMNSHFNCAHRVKFDLFNRFGAIAAAGDRHLAEFMPGNEYLDTAKTPEEWKFSLTSVAWRKADLQEKLDKSLRLLNKEEELDLSPTGEEGILLIKALCGLGQVVSNVNIPNAQLQIENLPAQAVVETNAIFDRDSIRPIFAGTMPEGVLKLTMPHLEIHEKVLEAALHPNFDLVVDAFMADPNVASKNVTRELAEELARDMIGGTMKYLPEKWKTIMQQSAYDINAKVSD